MKRVNIKLKNEGIWEPKIMILDEAELIFKDSEIESDLILQLIDLKK